MDAITTKTKAMLEAITGQYTIKDWASVALFGPELTIEQIVEAEWNAPFVHRIDLGNAIMRESGKYITTYDSALAILGEDGWQLR